MRLRPAVLLRACTLAFGFSFFGTAVAQWTMLPGDDALSASAGNQDAPWVAAGPGLSLAVWADYRSNTTGSYEYETGRDIYGMRLDGAGNPVEAVPFVVADVPGAQSNPKAAWNGSNWLVVFESTVLSGTGYYYTAGLQAVRVSAAGQVLDPKPISLYGLAPSGNSYCVATDGTNWVVVNQGTSASNGIFAVRIAPDGTVLDPPTRKLVDETYYGRSNFHLAYAAGTFLLTFDDDYVGGTFRTSLIRFAPNLVPMDLAPRNLLPVPLSELDSNGSGFYAVWNRQLPNFSMAVSGTRINLNGQALDLPGSNISQANPADYDSKIGVVWDGANWRAFWETSNLARFARVSTSGAVLDPGGVPVPGPSTGPAAAAGIGAVQLVWSQYTAAATDVFGAFVSPSNQAGPTKALSIGAPRQTGADIAVSPVGAMIVYRSVTSSNASIMAQAFDVTGMPNPSGPVVLQVGPSVNGPGAPNVAWNGTCYLVAWGASSGIYAHRLSPTGVKLEAAPFLVMASCFGAADVAAIGDTFFVSGRKFGYNPEVINAVGARVRGSDGAVLDPSPLLLGGWYVSRPPAVAELGGRFFAAFHSNWTHDNPMADTLGVFVPLSGAPTSTFAVGNSLSTSGGNGIFEIGLASNGTTAMVVHSQELSSGVETDLLFRLVSSSGAVSGYTNLTPWVGNQYRPRVSWDGTHFIVAYQEQKNRVAPWTLDQLDARSDLFAMRITPGGVKVDPMGFVLSSLRTAETDPTVNSNAGKSYFGASLMVGSPSYAAYRVHRQIRSNANKWPVAVATATPAGGDVPLPVQFSSAGSTDLDGSIASTFWDFGDGATSTAANPSHTFLTPGPFSVNLTVTDNQGASTRQTITVDATAPNMLPIAVARIAPSGGRAPLDVICYGDGSYDPDGHLGNFRWEFSDGGDYWGNVAYHTFAKPGKYRVTLTVWDSRGATGTTSKVVWVMASTGPIGSVRRP